MLPEQTETHLRVVDIVEGTAVDGPGLRTSIYFAGCAHRCPECHNSSTWPFDSGRVWDVEDVLNVVKYNEFNVTFSGGDPMYQAKAILPLAKAIKALGYTIWCYTGFTFEQLLQSSAPEGAADLLQFIDVLVDGPYVAALRDTDLRFRGSANQRLINVPESLKNDKVIQIEL